MLFAFGRGLRRVVTRRFETRLDLLTQSLTRSIACTPARADDIDDDDDSTNNRNVNNLDDFVAFVQKP